MQTNSQSLRAVDNALSGNQESRSTMTTEQLKSEVESGNMDKLADYAKALVQDLGATAYVGDERVCQLKRSIVSALYCLRLGETGRATEILNQALSA